jgi:hypothetical protein
MKWIDLTQDKDKWRALVNTVMNILTYLRSSALLEKLPIVQPLKNFQAFHGIRRLRVYDR